jgi:hypothetical protein
VFEICRGLSILDHDKVVVFVLEAGRGEVSRARAQKPAINLLALEMQSENRFSCSASTALISGSPKPCIGRKVLLSIPLSEIKSDAFQRGN